MAVVLRESRLHVAGAHLSAQDLDVSAYDGHNDDNPDRAASADAYSSAVYR